MRERTYQVEEIEGVSIIVLDKDLIRDSNNAYFEQIKTPEGILLKLVEVGEKLH